MTAPGPQDSQIDPHQLERAAKRLTESILADERTRHVSTAFLPHRRQIIRVLEQLTWLMFPGFVGPRELSIETLNDHVSSVLEDVGQALVEQVSGALRYERRIESRGNMFREECEECDARAAQVVSGFLATLPNIRELLSLDVQAAYDGDPAAQHTDETIFCYPGIRALTIHRLAHELYLRDLMLIPRIMSEHAHAATGIDIHPGARIGKSFFIDHGTGVVIGETTIIGDHCKLYQGVTLGAKSFPKDERGRLKRGIKRHPTLEDHVTVYAGATILGGETIIGAGSVINGGVFLTSSVPPGHIVRGPKLETKIRSNPELPPPMYQI
ncbi:MAG: serine O-acetyltransferase EpsC [Planctomycetota bacterium]|jgi:serine O-acetyltransferase